MYQTCCGRTEASQHCRARSAAGCGHRGENAAASAGAGVEHTHLPRACTRRSDARQEASGTGQPCPACPMLQRAGSRCWTALPRVAKPSRGCWMVRRASHRKPARTARPVVITAWSACLACTHKMPGRRPRPPRGARDGRIGRDGMGLVFFGFLRPYGTSPAVQCRTCSEGVFHTEGYQFSKVFIFGSCHTRSFLRKQTQKCLSP